MEQYARYDAWQSFVCVCNSAKEIEPWCIVPVQLNCKPSLLLCCSTQNVDTLSSQQCFVLSTCPRLPARNLTKHPWSRFLAAALWLRICHSPVSVFAKCAGGGRFQSYHLVLHIADWPLFSASRAPYAALWMARFIQLEPVFTRACQDAPLCFPHGIRPWSQVM
jgi:hypothetical protein